MYYCTTLKRNVIKPGRRFIDKIMTEVSYYLTTTLSIRQSLIVLDLKNLIN